MSMIDMLFGAFAALLGILVVVVSFINESGGLIGERKILLNVQVRCVSKGTEGCVLADAEVGVLMRVDGSEGCWVHLHGVGDTENCGLILGDACGATTTSLKAARVDPPMCERDWGNGQNLELTHYGSAPTSTDKAFDNPQLHRLVVLEAVDVEGKDLALRQVDVVPFVRTSPIAHGDFEVSVTVMTRRKIAELLAPDFTVTSDRIRGPMSADCEVTNRNDVKKFLLRTESVPLLCLGDGKAGGIAFLGDGSNL